MSLGLTLMIPRNSLNFEGQGPRTIIQFELSTRNQKVRVVDDDLNIVEPGPFFKLLSAGIPLGWH